MANREGFVSRAKGKYNRTKQKVIDYKKELDNIYYSAYSAGWKDCQENSPFGASVVGAIGYGNGFGARKRYYKAQKKLSTLNSRRNTVKA